jgi:CheY-like chemotaxis protein
MHKAGAATKSEAQAVTTPVHPLDGRVLLVVDDDFDSREILRAVLEHEGAVVITAESVMEALSLVDAVEPDVVLTDLSMPGHDGYELRDEVHRGAAPDTPVVALSGFSESCSQRPEEEHDFSARLTKPVDPKELTRTLIRVCELASQRPLRRTSRARTVEKARSREPRLDASTARIGGARRIAVPRQSSVRLRAR